MLETLSIMRVAEEEGSSRTVRNRGREANGVDARGRITVGREVPAPFLDAPRTTAEHTFCARPLKNPQKNKA